LFLIAFSKPFLDNDYYYGGSMRDLSSRHTGRRKSSSASHIGESFRNNRFFRKSGFHRFRGRRRSGIFR